MKRFLKSFGMTAVALLLLLMPSSTFATQKVTTPTYSGNNGEIVAPSRVNEDGSVSIMATVVDPSTTHYDLFAGQSTKNASFTLWETTTVTFGVTNVFSSGSGNKAVEIKMVNRHTGKEGS